MKLVQKHNLNKHHGFGNPGVYIAIKSFDVLKSLHIQKGIN